MTTVYDIPADIFNPALAAAMADQKAVSMPDWGQYVKTAVDRERPPTQENLVVPPDGSYPTKGCSERSRGRHALGASLWWQEGQRGHAQHTGVASRHIIRTALQQLEDAGLVEKVPTKEVDTEDGKVQLYAGRRITAAVKNWSITSLTRSVKRPKPSTQVWTSIEPKV